MRRLPRQLHRGAHRDFHADLSAGSRLRLDGELAVYEKGAFLHRHNSDAPLGLVCVQADALVFDRQPDHLVAEFQINRNRFRLGMLGNVAEALLRDVVDAARNIWGQGIWHVPADEAGGDAGALLKFLGVLLERRLQSNVVEYGGMQLVRNAAHRLGGFGGRAAEEDGGPG